MSLHEEKYLVVKMSDWEERGKKFVRNPNYLEFMKGIEDLALLETFTIRGQDIAGAAGLRGYASGALITLEALRKFAPDLLKEDPEIERRLLSSIDKAFVLADASERMPDHKVAD